MAATEDRPPVTAWLHAKGGELALDGDTGELLLCWTCPCCRPRVIASFITNGRDETRRVWNLAPYRGDWVGLPGSRWRLRDVGEAHHGNPSRGCEGTIYHQGEIDGRGRLAGLPEEFESSYGYDGYMEIQQGCVRKDGSVEWPCPNG